MSSVDGVVEAYVDLDERPSGVISEGDSTSYDMIGRLAAAAVACCNEGLGEGFGLSYMDVKAELAEAKESADSSVCRELLLLVLGAVLCIAGGEYMLKLTRMTLNDVKGTVAVKDRRALDQVEVVEGNPEDVRN